MFSIRFNGVYLCKKKKKKPEKNQLLQNLKKKYFINDAYRHPSGTTMRVASILEEGHTLHEKRTPSLCSGP
jgi:hypothetical protein